MSTTTLLLPVRGMHCASCALLIERTLSDLPGITKAEVNSASEKISLEFDPSEIPLEKITEHVRDLGYELVVPKTPHLNPLLEGEGVQRNNTSPLLLIGEGVGG